MARGWKHAVEQVVARAGLTSLAERAMRPSTVVLAYHNVVPHGERAAGDSSLHVDQGVFADQLDLILEDRDIVALGDALTTRAEGADRRPRVAITFDDGYLGSMTGGLEELGKRGVPATVFVPPGLLGSSGLWWDLLAPPDGQSLDARVREHAMGTLQGKTEVVMSWARDRGMPVQELPEHARPISVDGLREGLLPSGVTLGAHSWTHPNLATLPADEVERELGRVAEWLSDCPHACVSWLAYPYGSHNDGVVRIAERFFEGALLISGGMAERRGRLVGQRHRVPRLNVPRGLTLEGLRIRLAGLASI